MALYPAPLTAILGAIAAQNNGITLDPSQYIFGLPTQFIDPTGATNTSLNITVNTVDSPYQGSVTVTYKRLDLADLAVLLPQPIQGNGWVTVADFWAVLNANFGLNFVAGDLNDTDVLVIDGIGSGSVTLTAQPNSMGWMGTVTLPFIKGNFDLSTVVTVTTLPGLMYPNRDETKPYGELYSYWRDLSQWQADLESLTTATTDFDLLCTDLTAATGNAWVDNAQGRYSLQGATIVYNGSTAAFTPVAGSATTPNPSYQNVLVVQLGSGSLGYSGFLFLHYIFVDPFEEADGTPVNTVLLMHFDGASGSTTITDNTALNTATVEGGAALSVAQSKFGGSSLSLLASPTAGVVVPDNASLHLSGDLTIEMFIYLTGTASDCVIFEKSNGLSQSARCFIEIVANRLYFKPLGVADDGGSWPLQSVATMTLNNWMHIAVVHHQNVWTGYVNGQPGDLTVADASDLSTITGSMVIGNESSDSHGDNSLALPGFIDELRISNIARYTAAFTPPFQQFVVD